MGSLEKFGSELVLLFRVARGPLFYFSNSRSTGCKTKSSCLLKRILGNDKKVSQTNDPVEELVERRRGSDV